MNNTADLIGASIRRTDILEKVLGKTAYSQDFWMEGMLYGGVLRSPHPSARILVIHTTAAEQLPGVHAVMTAQDIPGQKLYGGPTILDHPVLADDVIRYAGQAIALVAAETHDLVEQALRLIEVEYELLPAVFDPSDALKVTAPQIGTHGNIASHEWLQRGDLAQGFAEADVVVEQTYHTTWIDHAPLEVECGVAWLDDQGGITLRISTQSIEYQPQIAAVLALPPEKVRVICPMVGGAFGRKLDITVELYIALLAWRTQRPVSLAGSREESIQAYSKRHPFTLHYKTGATHDGHLTAMQIRIIADAGPFVYRSALVSVHALMLATGPYAIPNVAIDVQAIHTNNIFTSAMRAVGGPQVNFAHESQMDQLAYELCMDPLILRRLNYLQPGQTLPNGQVIHDAVQLNEATEKVWQALEEIPRLAEVGTRMIGRGFSANFGGYGVPSNAASCAIEVQPDGQVQVSIGVCDIGGGQSSSVAQIAADVLGMPLAKITLRLADTMTTPLVGATAGSKTLYYCSHATSMAAQALKKKLLEIAADLCEAPLEGLLLQDGEIIVRDQARKKVTLLQVIEEARIRATPLSEHATFRTPQEKKFDSASGTGIDWPGFTFGAHAVEVAVDEDTGEVSVLRYACCYDVGRALHPQSVVGQMHGGVAQGIGFTLMEQVAIKNGIIQTPSLREYLIPTALDVPEIATIMLESGEGLGAYANRGIGEPPAAASASAIANAIYAAVGVRMTELPITSERIFSALQQYEDEF
ncbi:MAG: xanthine dehydrogenase family protein [Ktedonobacteraceae bacterium]|nr:xanthine dehydrogenase family protein [Ktedonobacteraceae bacterium]